MCRDCRRLRATGIASSLLPIKIRQENEKASARRPQHGSGHGGAAHPHSRRFYGSLAESTEEPEPASESVDDDTNDVVNRPTESSSSNAAAALAKARALSRVITDIGVGSSLVTTCRLCDALLCFLPRTVRTLQMPCTPSQSFR